MTYKYEAVVKTGDDLNAGTDRRVWFKIQGARAMTPWVLFNDLRVEMPSLFQPGQIASCEFTSDLDLGELEAVWLKLEPPHGTQPEWQVDTFEVMHGDDSDLWRVSQWLTPDTHLRVGPELKNHSSGNAVAIARPSANRDGRFTATADSPNKLGLRELLERFANEQRVATHMTPEQAADSVLDVFKRAVRQEMELLALECREG